MCLIYVPLIGSVAVTTMWTLYNVDLIIFPKTISFISHLMALVPTLERP